jgi:hypothetical protein
VISLSAVCLRLFKFNSAIEEDIDGNAYTAVDTASQKTYYPGSQASSTKILTLTEDGGNESIARLRSG